MYLRLGGCVLACAHMPGYWAQAASLPGRRFAPLMSNGPLVRNTRTRIPLRVVGLGYLTALLVAPLVYVCMQAFKDGFGAFWDAVSSPDAVHALRLTLTIAAIAVPANTIFGVAAALVLVRGRFRGKRLVWAFIDLPLALSPVVVGLSLVLLWGKNGWFGGWAQEHGVRVIFATPGMVLATIMISLPFVAREVAPVLREVGVEAEEAAATLGAGGAQTFLRITLPAIRWGLIYGVILTTARALGEYGAVSVVSGHIAGETETLTQHVDQRFQAFDLVGAYAASLVLALLAVAAMALMGILNAKERRRWRSASAE